MGLGDFFVCTCLFILPNFLEVKAALYIWNPLWCTIPSAVVDTLHNWRQIACLGKSLLLLPQRCFTPFQPQGKKNFPNRDQDDLIWRRRRIYFSLTLAHNFVFFFCVQVIRSPFDPTKFPPTTNQGNSEIAFLVGGPVGFSCSLAFSSYIRILVEMGRDTGIREQSSQENRVL